ncbi:hypothetical protein C1A38_05300 [Verrucosispora sp. ts21]|uniref:hypothetical protein n=1 Tax=Verrucosispora sp. ts21 TaxID=2069341 RepID=UPI000C88D12E|nr:hypothetical protein [Verrucosispora sp. ts21]PMR62151.1 hypothetical protein C1A38_05300 [Verrucosispora sp. ts21]
MRHRRLLLAAFFLLILVSATACGAQAEQEPAASSEPTPRSSEVLTPSPSAPAAQSPPRTTALPAELLFSETMVRSHEVNKHNKGGQANVEMVAGTNDLTTLERLGHECVDAFLRQQTAAFCKVFGTDADYRSRDLRKVGDSNCWAFYVGVPLTGGEPIVTAGDEFGYDAERCPGKLYR